MLILTRKVGHAVHIDLVEDLDPRTPVGELFSQGPIEIVVTGIRGEQVKLGLTADPRFRILREELRPDTPAAHPLPRTANRRG